MCFFKKGTEIEKKQKLKIWKNIQLDKKLRRLSHRGVTLSSLLWWTISFIPLLTFVVVGLYYDNPQFQLNFPHVFWLAEKLSEKDNISSVVQIALGFFAVSAAYIVLFYSVMDHRIDGIPYRHLMSSFIGSITIPALFVFSLIELIFTGIFYALGKYLFALGLSYSMILSDGIAAVMIMWITSYSAAILYIKNEEIRQLNYIENNRDKLKEYSRNDRYQFTDYIRMIAESGELKTDKYHALIQILGAPIGLDLLKQPEQGRVQRRFRDLHILYEYYYQNISDTLIALEENPSEMEDFINTLYDFSAILVDYTESVRLGMIGFLNENDEHSEEHHSEAADAEEPTETNIARIEKQHLVILSAIWHAAFHVDVGDNAFYTKHLREIGNESMRNRAITLLVMSVVYFHAVYHKRAGIDLSAECNNMNLREWRDNIQVRQIPSEYDASTGPEVLHNADEATKKKRKKMRKECLEIWKIWSESLSSPERYLAYENEASLSLFDGYHLSYEVEYFLRNAV